MWRLLAIALALVISGCTVDIDADSILPHDSGSRRLDVADMRPGHHRRVEPLDLTYPDGVVGHGIRMRAPSAAAVIVYLPGNKMSIAEYGPRLLPSFAQIDADVIWLDRRGLGATGGKADLRELQSDAQAMLALAAREDKPVIVHGLSLGSLLAGTVANDPRVAALVLEGALTSIPNVADASVPDVLKGVIHVRVDPRIAAFDNVAVLQHYDKPLLLLAGSDDKDIPPVHARTLYAAARTRDKTLVIAQGKTHVDAMTSDAAIAAYRRMIASLDRPNLKP